MARRWRFYPTAARRSPVREFLDSLSDAQAAQVLAALRIVASLGLAEARHLRGDVYEVRASIGGQAYRVLFANEGRRGQILLALEGFEKKSRPTPLRTITLAEKRLAGWSQVRTLLLLISRFWDRRMSGMARMQAPDDLDQYIAERARKSPQLPAMVAARTNRRELQRQLADRRVALGMTPTEAAVLMPTSQSSIARLESGEQDVRMSTLERYAALLARNYERAG